MARWSAGGGVVVQVPACAGTTVSLLPVVCGVRLRVFGGLARPGLAGAGLASFPASLRPATFTLLPLSPGVLFGSGPGRWRQWLTRQRLGPLAQLPLPISQVALAGAPLRSGTFNTKLFLFAAMIHTPKAVSVERVPCVQGQARYRSAVQSSCMIQVREVFYGLSIGVEGQFGKYVRLRAGQPATSCPTSRRSGSGPG